MIVKGQNVNNDITRIHKSINTNLKNKDIIVSEKKDTAETGIRLTPPIPMSTCLYIFKNSSHVAKCSRILADDLIYNTITLTPDTINEPEEHLINQVNKINEFLNDNIDELHNLSIDYNYAGWAAIEYKWDNTRFLLQQIPIHTCSIIRISLQGNDYYLLEQRINSTIRYFRIMGEDYPDQFHRYNNQELGYASLIGGDNIYQFFSLPPWIQSYEEILTEIAIKSSDYKTISKGNISSGVLNINMEPQVAKPLSYDTDGNPVVMESREETISKELQNANGGVAVIFTESNRPMNMDYVTLTNNNHQYLADLKLTTQQSVLNDYSIPLVRLMINTDKESMNSDKTKSIWEIYTLDLRNKQEPYKQFIRELIYELYSINVNVDISTPIFSDRREIETKLHSQAWNDGAINLKQYITALSDFLDVVDLNDYDFNSNPEIWEYRKIPELNPGGLSEDDLQLIEEVEAELNENKQV